MLSRVRASEAALAAVITIGLAAGLTGCVTDPGIVARESEALDDDLVPRGTDRPYDVVPGIIDFGRGKPPQPYDGFLTVAFQDIGAFWAQQYPAVYGAEWTPLQGGVYAGYPERVDAVPGCGTDESTYDDVAMAGAFYCRIGDFIAYDDHALLPTLVDELGQEAVAIVLAHEFGHAVQARAGTFEQPVILKEQQADCFAGAWAARVAVGDSDSVLFDDVDVRAGLIAMLQIRDPVEAGGLANPDAHGTGFDRVGAFQDGFLGGVERCARFFEENRLARMIDIPFVFEPNLGNLPLRDPAGEGSDIVTLIPASLEEFWVARARAADAPFTTPTFRSFVGEDPPTCDGVDDLRGQVRWCAADNTIYWDEQTAAALANDPLTGDLSVGYLFAAAYGDAIQAALGSRRSGESRALMNDCLAGAWVRAIVPPTPADTVLQLSAGDLDEAVITVISRSDDSADTDIVGSGFEKVSAFRTGVLGGLEVCAGLR